MERRRAKINVSAAGGTASKGAKTCKVTLPTAWLNAMELGEDREVELSFDGEQIVICRRLSGDEFAAKKRSLGHDVRLLSFYENSSLCTTIYADFTEKTLVAENHVEDMVKTAFGRNKLPAWEDFLDFLESRCIPRRRAGLREYLDVLGVDEYDPLAIIEKTDGRMAEDSQWLEVKKIP